MGPESPPLPSQPQAEPLAARTAPSPGAERGAAAWRSSDVPEAALEALLTAASRGEAVAQFQLGDALFGGHVLPRCAALARFW